MKRMIAPLLVFAMLISVFPSVNASEITDSGETISAAEREETAESGLASDVIEQSYVTVDDPGEYAISAFSVKKRGTLRNYNCMDFTTSDGIRRGFHYADEDGAAPWEYMNMIYCLEQDKAFSVGSGHTGAGDLPIDGEGDAVGEKVWYSLSADQRVAIGLILLYGAPTKLWDTEGGLNTPNNRNLHNPNVGYRFATQALVWEIAAGWREATPPYALINDYWYEHSIGQCTSEDGSVDHFLVGYNAILEDMRTHNLIPSFTSDFAATAPEIQMEGNQITLCDSNQVLSRFDFTNTDTISYSKHGNELIVTASGVFPTDVQSAISVLPDPAASLYEVWYNQNDGSKQTCIKVSMPASDPVPAYFKLKGSTGNLALIKITEDGENLGGWQFGIYADQSCTNLLTGPVESDNNGKLTITGLMPGVVWVKELGHKDAEINEMYYCETLNPQAAIVDAEETAIVTFTNRLRCGSIAVQKVDNTSTPRAGAEFLLEWSEDTITWQAVTCADPAKLVKGGCSSSGLTEGRLVSGEDGMVRYEGLHPELYYRLTETKAPDGLQLLADYAFEGRLPKDKDLTVSLRVVNTPGFALPKTGSNTAALLPIGLVLCLAACVGMLTHLRRKEQSVNS